MNIAHRAGTEVYGPDVFDAVSHSGQAGADAESSSTTSKPLGTTNSWSATTVC